MNGISLPAFLVALLVVSLGLQSPAQALECGAKATQSDLNVCADQDFRRSDAALNVAYRQIMARLKADRDATEGLVATQRAWLAFRDAECRFSGSASAGGSVYPMVVAQCRSDLTKRRVTDLEAYLLCPEGDLGCPVPQP